MDMQKSMRESIVRIMIHIESTKTASMEDASTRVFEKK